MAEDKKPALLPEVAAEFEMLIHEPGNIHLPDRFGGKTVDFRSITLETARSLAAMEGFPYLKRKGPTVVAGLEKKP